MCHDSLYGPIISSFDDMDINSDLGGTIVMAMAGIKNGAGLLTARFFLGIPESGIGKAISNQANAVFCYANHQQFPAVSCTSASGIDHGNER